MPFVSAGGFKISVNIPGTPSEGGGAIPLQFIDNASFNFVAGQPLEFVG